MGCWTIVQRCLLDNILLEQVLRHKHDTVRHNAAWFCEKRCPKSKCHLLACFYRRFRSIFVSRPKFSDVCQSTTGTESKYRRCPVANYQVSRVIVLKYDDPHVFSIISDHVAKVGQSSEKWTEVQGFLDQFSAAQR